MEREKTKRKKNRYRVPELLAPAGNKEAFIAAVEAGADAIYCGGKNFNARAGAENFDVPELREAVAFAHKRGVKVYITLNTLLMDSELGAALEYVGELWDIGVDALIIQDLGLAGLIKETYPDFPLHLSTQATIYDLAGVLAAKDLGFSQVVLARELSLSEIRDICKNVDIDIEVFCHGAICFCYSGQCQMSRAIGGRSGNRGGCAQPCRLEYKSFDEDGHLLDEPYPLSPSDMDLIDYLGDLADAGVACLKIEGRMKSPEYVAVVTSIYRKYLDMYASSGEYRVSPEDRFALTQIFNRGFTDAYLSGTQDEGFMSGELSKNKGVFVGRVSNAIPIKGAKDRFYVDVRLDAGSDDESRTKCNSDLSGVSKGDTLELRLRTKQGLKTTSFYVTYLEELDSGLLRLGDVKDRPERGYEVYRISSKSQLDDAAIYYKNKDWDTGKFIRKLKLRGDVTFDGDVIKLTLRSPDGRVVAVETTPGEGATGGASDQENVRGNSRAPLDQDQVRERIFTALGKTGGTPFTIDPVHIHGEHKGSVSAATLNALRRDAVSQMEEELAKVTRAHAAPEFEQAAYTHATPEFEQAAYTHATPEFAKAVRANTEPKFAKTNLNASGVNSLTESELYFYSMKSLDAFLESGELPEGVRIVLPLAEFFDPDFASVRNRLADFGHSENVFLYISNVAKGREMDLVNKYLDEAKVYCEENNTFVYAGNLSQVHLLKEKGIPFGGDYGLNIYNEASARRIVELGAEECVPSLEVDGVHFGRVPLMITEQTSPVARIEDRKGRDFTFLRAGYSDQRRIVFSDGEYRAADSINRPARIYIGS